jgi:hypothetical protein
MHIKSATGEKTVKNVETCAYNTGYYEWLCVRMTYLHTYLLTPWSRVLLEKLTGFADSQEIPRIYGTRNFITVFTSVRHLSLS